MWELLTAAKNQFIHNAIEYVRGLDDNTIAESEILLTAENILVIFPELINRFSDKESEQILNEIKYQSKHHPDEQIRIIMNEVIKKVANNG
jgi:hypothetical protein